MYQPYIVFLLLGTLRESSRGVSRPPPTAALTEGPLVNPRSLSLITEVTG